MEKFVLRGDAAAALAASVLEAQPPRRRQRQTTIRHGDKVVVQERVQYLKDEMEDAKTTTSMLAILGELEQLFVSLEMLEKTLVGRALTRLLRRSESGTRLLRRSESEEVRERAQKLLRLWKSRAKKAARRRARRVETYGRNYGD